MKPQGNAIAGRLSLRKPQRDSLKILDRVTEIVPPLKAADLAAALEIIRSEYPTVTDFEREFPSLCFALATGVGKTRLMGAFISYLHLAHGLNNFFVLAPNLTIYNKIIDEANKPDSAIRLKTLILDPRTDLLKIATVLSSAGVLAQLGGQSFESSLPTLTQSAASAAKPIFTTQAEQKVAQVLKSSQRKTQPFVGVSTRRITRPRTEASRGSIC